MQRLQDESDSRLLSPNQRTDEILERAIAKLPDDSDPKQPGLKELLTQLQGAIETEPQLSQDDKAEALEQVKVLAEAGQKPQDGPLKKMANTAIKVIKGTVASLPEATKLVEECGNLLPIITKLLGLP
jgi:hypothetical protein